MSNDFFWFITGALVQSCSTLFVIIVAHVCGCQLHRRRQRRSFSRCRIPMPWPKPQSYALRNRDGKEISRYSVGDSPFRSGEEEAAR